MGKSTRTSHVASSLALRQRRVPVFVSFFRIQDLSADAGLVFWRVITNVVTNCSTTFLLICQCDGKPEGMATDFSRAEIAYCSPQSPSMCGGVAISGTCDSQETRFRANDWAETCSSMCERENEVRAFSSSIMRASDFELESALCSFRV